jgi:3D (Asp-Asp-Asp) domain-containing protein
MMKGVLVGLAMLAMQSGEEGLRPLPTPLLPPRPEVPFVFSPLPPRPIYCRQARITGYVRTAPYFNPHTKDGTSILTAEPIGAASLDVPLQSVVDIEGYGQIRIADRGHLEPGTHIDVAVWSTEEAYSLTGYRTVCIVPPLD